MAAWHPRGEPTWPGWKTAPPGTRVEMIRTGRRGTLVRAQSARRGISAGASYAVVDWDNGSRGRVTAPAFDLRPL